MARRGGGGFRCGTATLTARRGAGPSENDWSLVVRLEDARWSPLLPGDLEVAGQQSLLDRGFTINAELLVAPRHGSATALFPVFLEAVRAEQTIVSAAGHRGLPAPGFLEAVESLGVRARTTYEEGALHASYRAGRLRVQPAAD